MEAETPIDDYRQEFDDAMRCYNAMETTKRRHFDYLSMLDSKQKKFNLSATDAESDILRLLLRDHDEEVKAFKQQCQLLKNVNEAAHQALFQRIGFLNQALDPSRDAVSH